MNRRFARRRPLGDDPVSAAAAAAVAAASTAANGAQTAAPVHHRKKHRRHHAVAATADASGVSAMAPLPASAPSAVSSQTKPSAKRSHKRSLHKLAGAGGKPTDQDATAAGAAVDHHGHLLLIGGAVVGLGLVALILARRGDEQPSKEQPVREREREPMRTA